MTKDAACEIMVCFSIKYVTFLFLSEDCKKSPPIIPGISTTPGAMIFAGSIGTQIANELLDLNRYGSRTAQLITNMVMNMTGGCEIFFFLVHLHDYSCVFPAIFNVFCSSLVDAA